MIIHYQVPITDDVQTRAASLAKRTGRTIEEILPALMMLTGRVFSHPIPFDRVMAELPDLDVLALSHLHMVSSSDERYTYLLSEQGKRPLSPSEQSELDIFLRVYEIGLLYQSDAIAETVKRGLISKLT